MLLAQAKLVVSRVIAKVATMLGFGYDPSKHYMRGPGPKAREAKRRTSVGDRTKASAHG